MKDITACLSHQSDDWKTPSKLYQAFMDQGFIDACPYKCDDDLYGVIYFHQKIYINPPFSELDRWIKYALILANHGNSVYLLMPVRTDTKYFNNMFHSGYLKRMIFFNHRLCFNDSKPAPFPSMICILGYDAPNYPSAIKPSVLSLDGFIEEYL